MATMHVDEIKALARQAHGDPRLRKQLFADMMGEDRDAAVHAAWTLTHLPKEDNSYIADHRETLAQKAIATPDTSLRRLSLALTERIDWTNETPSEYFMRLLDFCLEHLMRRDEPYGVRSLCMKIAYKLSLPYPELQEELRQSLLLLEPSELGAGVLHTRNKLLKIIRT